MKKNLTPLFGALMALALLASACGGDDASAADQEVIDAVAAQISGEGGVPPELDVNCMASAMVSGMGGAEVMEESFGLTAASITAGQEPDDVELSVEDARSMGDGMMDCGLGDMMVNAIAGAGVTEEQASCVLENLDEDVIRDAFAVEFMSDADADVIGAAADDAMEVAVPAALIGCDVDF